jgi:hypothetical protein
MLLDDVPLVVIVPVIEDCVSDTIRYSPAVKLLIGEWNKVPEELPMLSAVHVPVQ